MTYRLLCSVCGTEQPGIPDKAWRHDDDLTGRKCNGTGRSVLKRRVRQRSPITDRQWVLMMARSYPNSTHSVRSASAGLPTLGLRR